VFCVVGVYGLWPILCGQLWDVPSRVASCSGIFHPGWPVVLECSIQGGQLFWNVPSRVVSCSGMCHPMCPVVLECSIQCGQLSWNVPSHDSWPHWTDHNPYTPTTQNIAWVAYKAPTTPWRWQPFAETCRGRIWNALIKSTTSLSICWSFYNDNTRCSVQLSRYIVLCIVCV
jgi:hypothetical protein